jgi:putative chitobiose transport system permease protein
MSAMIKTAPVERAARRRPAWRANLVWYALMAGASLITVLPFVWLLTTSLKGPADAVFSLPPQLLPRNPTLGNFARVWSQLAIWRFFLNSIFVATLTVALSVLVA